MILWNRQGGVTEENSTTEGEESPRGEAAGGECGRMFFDDGVEYRRFLVEYHQGYKELEWCQKRQQRGVQ
jgi:hypothetical protein